MRIQSYLFFNGRCEEALEFYRHALGAEIQTLIRFKDSPEPPQAHMPPGSENKVMHANFLIGETQLMASDGDCSGASKFDGFSLSANAADVATAEQWFNDLCDGGKVIMPLAKTFFSESFGMLQDRFGLNWMIIVEPAQ